MAGNVTLSITVPFGTCYENPETDWPLLVSLITANLAGSLSTVNTGSTTPAAGDRDKPWIRSNSDGTDDGQWVFYNGFWVQKHPMPVGAVIMFEGAEADIATFDGGESATITNITGPFWERVTEMNARSPIGPGTLPSGTVIAIGDNIGEEKHVQLITELVGHNHDIPYSASGDAGGAGAHILNLTPQLDNLHFTENTGKTPPDGMNVIQPSRGIWFLRRTARTYRRRNA